MRHTLKVWIVACCVVPLLSTTTIGQEPGSATESPRAQQQPQSQDALQRQQQGQQQQRQQRGAEGQRPNQTAQLNQILAAWLVFDNQKEIAISELGERFAQSDEVRQFAERMTQEHRDLVDQLQQHLKQATQQDQQRTGAANRQQQQARGSENTATGDRSSEGPGATTAQDQQTAQTQEDRPAGLASQPGQTGQRQQMRNRQGAGMELLQIKQQICEQNAQSIARELTEKQGEKFDKAFMGAQIAGHLMMLDTLTVLENQTSGELQSLVREGRQTTQQHLEEAKNIMRNLDEQHHGQAGQQQPERQPTTSPRN